MGKFIDLSANAGREPTQKNLQRCAMTLVIRLADLKAWADYVTTLPDSYTMHVAQRMGAFAFVDLIYVARGANTHDIGRRLRTAGLEYVRGGATNEKLGEE